MNKIIIFSFIMISIIIYKKYITEDYTDYVKQMNNTDQELKVFCTELNKLNSVDNNTLLIQKYNTRLKEIKDKEIKSIKKEIDDIYLKRLNSEIDNHNRYRLSNNEKINKQIKLVNLAKKNIISDNNIDISVN
jgi:hypothetical protein